MTIAPEIQQMLPAVFTDYLGTLILSEMDTLDAALLECKLDIVKLGGRPIQQIEFWGKQHIVFGFPPVQCKLLVLISQESCKMYRAS